MLSTWASISKNHTKDTIFPSFQFRISELQSIYFFRRVKLLVIFDIKSLLYWFFPAEKKSIHWVVTTYSRTSFLFYHLHIWRPINTISQTFFSLWNWYYDTKMSGITTYLLSNKIERILMILLASKFGLDINLNVFVWFLNNKSYHKKFNFIRFQFYTSI